MPRLAFQIAVHANCQENRKYQWLWTAHLALLRRCASSTSSAHTLSTLTSSLSPRRSYSSHCPSLHTLHTSGLYSCIIKKPAVMTCSPLASQQGHTREWLCDRGHSTDEDCLERSACSTAVQDRQDSCSLFHVSSRVFELAKNASHTQA